MGTGALPLETAFPRKERQGLLMALNNLLASPSFESWRTASEVSAAAGGELNAIRSVAGSS